MSPDIKQLRERAVLAREIADTALTELRNAVDAIEPVPCPQSAELIVQRRNVNDVVFTLSIEVNVVAAEDGANEDDVLPRRGAEFLDADGPCEHREGAYIPLTSGEKRVAIAYARKIRALFNL